VTAELTLTNLRRTIASSIMAKGNSQKMANGSTLDFEFEAQLWAAADKMRRHMDVSEYKHVCLGLKLTEATA
jgi:type I restriction enzyme M protein